MRSSQAYTGLQRLFNVRREELLPVLLSALFFFCVLTALMLLRPAREALGMQRGIEAVRWLFIGTALVTLLVNPVFGLLVSRLPRLRFISATYVFFALSLLAFYLVMVLAPEAIGVTTGQVFYVWFSVFNLFVTMVFWALMADRFSLEQGKRFFGLIAVGGTAEPSSAPGWRRCWPNLWGQPRCCWSRRGSSCWRSPPPGRWHCCNRHGVRGEMVRKIRNSPPPWTSGR